MVEVKREPNGRREKGDSSTKQLNKKGDTRGLHPNSLKNLEKRESWVKGESGNPQGQSITSKQKQMMPEVCPFDAKGRIWLDALAEGGMRMALTQSTALTSLQDRHEGKVTLPIGGEDGKPIELVVIVKDSETKSLIARVAERTGKQIHGD